MLVLDRARIVALTSLPELVEELRVAFRSQCIIPPRQVMSMPGATGERLFISMPAFSSEGATTVKLVTFLPDNPANGRPTIQAVIVVFFEAGTPVALLDGSAVTQLRTSAASALASQYLSPSDSSHLVVIGTGELAPMMAAAHCAVRPISRVSVWGRRHERAVATAGDIRRLVRREIEIALPESLAEAVQSADIVSCATGSTTPLLAGKWLRPGTFVDLIGSFSPSKREADDDVVLRSRIFVDTLEGALAEAGDILHPLARGIIQRERVVGELADLVSGRQGGRQSVDEIITFKSVGTALEDLAAARLIVAAAKSALAGERA